jgi:hypothetical protein
MVQWVQCPFSMGHVEGPAESHQNCQLPLCPAELFALKSYKGVLWHKCVSMCFNVTCPRACSTWENPCWTACSPEWKCARGVSDAIVCLRKTPTHISTLKSLTTARLSPSTAFYLSWNADSRCSPNDTIELQPYDFVCEYMRVPRLYRYWQIKYDWIWLNLVCVQSHLEALPCRMGAE